MSGVLEKISISGQGSSPRGGRRIQVDNLDDDESEHLMGALSHGSNWVCVNGDGRLQTHPVFKSFPDPVEDVLMHPHWSAPDASGPVSTHKKDIHFEKMCQGESPSYFISHLCGYNYTEEGYQMQARRLQSYGFFVMRSQRGKDGKYWEQWVLLGHWAAEGLLKHEIERLKKDTTLGSEDRNEMVRDFLCKTVEFGTLDMVVQRAAMALD